MAEKEGTIHLDRYTTDAKQVVAGAQQIADERQHTEVTPLHLLVRLLLTRQSLRASAEIGRAPERGYFAFTMIWSRSFFRSAWASVVDGDMTVTCSCAVSS